MEKIKNFVIKYQLWIKLVSIALLVCVIFTPYIVSAINLGKKDYVSSYSFWNLIIDNNDSQEYLPKYRFHFISTWFIFFIILTVISLIIINIVTKKSNLLTFACIFFIIAFFIILATEGYSLWFYYYAQIKPSGLPGYTFPHIAFFISILLIFLDIMVLIQLMKEKKSTAT